MITREAAIEAAVLRAMRLVSAGQLKLDNFKNFVSTAVHGDAPDLKVGEIALALKIVQDRIARNAEIAIIANRLGERFGTSNREQFSDIINRGMKAGDPVAIAFNRRPPSGLTNDEQGVLLLHNLRAAEEKVKVCAPPTKH
jgi:hypothetical protein